MYYVVREGQSIENYHARYHEQTPAVEYAMNLKASLGHNYNIVKVETVLTTRTLAERWQKTSA